MTICDNYTLDSRTRQDVMSGAIPRGCISCAHCDSFGRCRATGRGRDLPDGSFLSLSGRREDWEDREGDAMRQGYDEETCRANAAECGML